MTNRTARNFLPASVALWLAAVATAAFGQDTDSVFARVYTDDNGRPRALQTAIASYVPADGRRELRVDLVSAVHVADAAYYAALNDRFRQYDALLYELIAPRGMVVTRDAEKSGIISLTQQLLTHALGLSFQLDEIDYTPANFVHADLSPEELAASMAARDESLYSYFWRVVFVAIRDYARDPLGVSDWQNLASVVGGSGDASFKTLLAYELADGQSIEAIFGDDADSSVIGVRNARAIEVLRDLLDQGVSAVGIFYGAGHMPDLEERLLSLGLVHSDTEWLDAWHLDAQGNTADEPISPL